MDIGAWIMAYVLDSLVCAWVLFWGGADWLERHFTWLDTWNAEQHRFYALCVWVGSTLIFIPVLFYF